MLNGLFDTVNHSFELYGKQMINSQISNKSAIEKISQDLKMSVSALNLLKDDLSNELSKTIPSIMQSLFVSKK
jgi:hypothetical protein